MPLILVENGQKKGARFQVEAPGPWAIGRDKTTEIPIPDPMVSRRHCAIELREGAYRVRDLGSANGTSLNGERVTEAPLKLGDRIQAGETLLTFVGNDAIDPLVGKRLKGYEILERVGRGGMGTVYRARQVSLDRYVALKVLSPELVEDPVFVARFLEEARAAARLSHPNIVMVYDIDDEVLEGQRIVYYSMEFMSGGSVEDILRKEGPFGAERALRVALDTARGLQYAEQVGLVHRDIKPGNLMVHETGIVKIGDLGIATRSTAGGMAAQKSVSGSPHYISPEQARGQDLDTRADIYSLGASIFQMLVGRPPFHGSDIRELLHKHLREPAPDLAALLPGLHPTVPPIVAKMLEKNRDLRPANARHLATSLEDALARLRDPEAPLAGRRRTVRIVAIAAAALAVLAAVGAGGGLLALRYRQYRNDRARAESRLLGGLEEARSALGAGRIDDAEARVDEIQGDPVLDREHPEVAAEAEVLRKAILEARRHRDQERRKADASAALAALRADLPDLGTLEKVEEFEKLAKSFDEFVRLRAGTPAAEEARKEAERIRSSAKALGDRYDRARDLLRSRLITVNTFLESSPPRYREALERLRETRPDVRGTPSEPELDAKIRTATEGMARDAAAWIQEARDEAAAGRRQEAAARLGRLRDRVEGTALESIDEAIQKLGGGKS